MLTILLFFVNILNIFCQTQAEFERMLVQITPIINSITLGVTSGTVDSTSITSSMFFYLQKYSSGTTFTRWDNTQIPFVNLFTNLKTALVTSSATTFSTLMNNQLPLRPSVSSKTALIPLILDGVYPATDAQITAAKNTITTTASEAGYTFSDAETAEIDLRFKSVTDNRQTLPNFATQITNYITIVKKLPN